MWRPDVPSVGGGAPPLLRALLATDIVVVPNDVAAQLVDIRAARPTILWFGVNERRVDAVVDTDDGEQFRLVYVTDDGVSVESVAVFRRPAPVAALVGGRVLVVNGPSGAGKSSALAALAALSPDPWVVFDEPVMGVVEQSYLIWRDRAPHLHRGFLEAMAALARSGNRVGLSAAGHAASVIEDVFGAVPTLRVGLLCDVETLRERQRSRDSRWGGLVDASLAAHDGWQYDVTFDTATATPTAIATELHTLMR